LSRIFQRLMSGSRLRSSRAASAPPATARQDLPVAAHPAVLASRVGEHARGEVVHHLDVRHQRAAREQALEQVVREHRVLRHATLERAAKASTS
jgi:hypothetical protein